MKGYELMKIPSGQQLATI